MADLKYFRAGPTVVWTATTAAGTAYLGIGEKLVDPSRNHDEIRRAEEAGLAIEEDTESQ